MRVIKVFSVIYLSYYAVVATFEGVAEAKSSEQPLVNRTITYEEPAVAWKVLWDQARELAEQEKFTKALVQYELLLSQKDNLDAARWEYVSILLHEEHWQEALDAVNKLLAIDPENEMYILAYADANFGLGNFEAAAQSYEKIAKQSPVSNEGFNALEKQARIFEKQGRHADAVRILRKLVQTRPQDNFLQLRLAEQSLALGNVSETENLLATLSSKKIAELRRQILLIQARLYSKKGENEQAASLWQQLVGIDPTNIEAHQALANYYFLKGNKPMELKHIEEQLRYNPDVMPLLLRCARVNRELQQFDRSLQLYNRIITARPNDNALRDEKKEVERLFAAELFPLVENSGSQPLWEDLIKMTDDPTGIYIALADLLRVHGKQYDLADVLKILWEHHPDNQLFRTELTSLLRKQNRLKELEEMEIAN